MKVGIYCPFVLQTNTGIARYTRGLVDSLATESGANPDTEYGIFWPPQAKWPENLPVSFRRISLDIHSGGGSGNPLGRIVREVGYLRRVRANTFPFDLFHSPFGYLPLKVPSRTIVTLPDMRAIRLPHTFTRVRGAFLRRIIPYSLRHADLVLAMSQATRSEALALVRGLRGDRIRVAYPGVDAHWFAPVNPADAHSTQAQHGLTGEPYVLAVGTREPHKNLPRLIDAFALLRSEPRFRGLRLCLVGATFATGASDNISARIRACGLESAVVSPGIVSEAALKHLYAGASVLVFPSLYEGFGYPPLEAMAVGTPVVTSNASCLPEIVGDAARLADPLSAESIAENIRILLADTGRRDEFILRGHRRVARYTWESHASDVHAAYVDTLGS